MRDPLYTILELLVVIALLGLLIGLVGPRVMKLFGSSKHRIAGQSITQLADVLDFYKLDMGGYPTTAQGLRALVTAPSGTAGRWRGPYLKQNGVSLDPWGRPFQYRSPSTRTGRAYDVYTLGAEGQPGGDDENADIFNE